MKCWHHNDMDGRAAAAVVFKWYTPHGKADQSTGSDDIQFIEIDYKKDPDFSKVAKGEKVIIVDFSFKPEVMDKLMLKTKNIIWVDHHESAKDYPYDKTLDGLRDFKPKHMAGCELAWKYFFPDVDAPVAIRLIGDYDKFALEYKNSTNFYEGLKTYPHMPTAGIWGQLLEPNAAEKVSDIIDEGVKCIEYRDAYCVERLKADGYDVEFEGLKCKALNVYGFGSLTFKSVIDNYDAVIAYIHDGSKYTVSMYSDRDDIDVSKICQKHGGGGHFSAAGYTCTELPFKPAK